MQNLDLRAMPSILSTGFEIQSIELVLHMLHMQLSHSNLVEVYHHLPSTHLT